MPSRGVSTSSNGEDGVLLYYKYVPLSDVQSIVRWYEDLCSRLVLVGRIRVSPEGVNVTVGGSASALEDHIKQVRTHPSLGECDFKVAHCSQPLLENPVLVRECGFDSLSVRAVKELVSLGNGATHITPAAAGVHLLPAEFHQRLLAATSELREAGSDPGETESGIVVLDARNVYETRIGRFRHLPGVEFCDPHIRQFSDLPAWLDANEDRLRDKHVFMYCTGGVRCERASAYLRVKGPAFRNVYQLSGGIQRYLEAFPDGGLFEGKNFVFDPRVAVGSSHERKVGRCLLCESPFDDYTPRCRCSQCRLLVLVCDSCRAKAQPADYVCELCQAASRPESESRARDGVSEDRKELGGGLSSKSLQLVGKGSSAEGCEHGLEIPDAAAENGSEHGCGNSDPGEPLELGKTKALSGGLAPRRRLRVLCLHGFRQTGRGLKGRLAAFQRQLGDLLELVFVDGPFQLPCVYYPKQGEGGSTANWANQVDRVGGGQSGLGGPEKGSGGEGSFERPKGTDFGTEAQGQKEGAGLEHAPVGEEGCLYRSERPDVNLASCVQHAADAATWQPGGRALADGEARGPTRRGPFPKFAWLVSLEQQQEIERAAKALDVDQGKVDTKGCKGGACRQGDLKTGTAGLSLKEVSRLDPEKEAGAEKSGFNGEGMAGWRPAATRFGPVQYLTQTAGWEASLSQLRRIFSEQGPFDGVLGFSQGAAVGAALCRYMSEKSDGPCVNDSIAFRFVVLCSGFPSPAEGVEDGSSRLIDLPSLHVYGGLKGTDRQVQVAESERLAEQFEKRHRLVVQHSAGHIVPISKTYTTQYRCFFARFL